MTRLNRTHVIRSVSFRTQGTRPQTSASRTRRSRRVYTWESIGPPAMRTLFRLISSIESTPHTRLVRQGL